MENINKKLGVSLTKEEWNNTSWRLFNYGISFSFPFLLLAAGFAFYSNVLSIPVGVGLIIISFLAGVKYGLYKFNYSSTYLAEGEILLVALGVARNLLLLQAVIFSLPAFDLIFLKFSAVFLPDIYGDVVKELAITPPVITLSTLFLPLFLLFMIFGGTYLLLKIDKKIVRKEEGMSYSFPAAFKIVFRPTRRLVWNVFYFALLIVFVMAFAYYADYFINNLLWINFYGVRD